MSIILNILYWILIIILIILLIAIYILVSKRSFYIEYTKLDGLILQVRVLWFKLNIFKSNSQDEKQTTQEKKDTKKEQEKKSTQKPKAEQSEKRQPQTKENTEEEPKGKSKEKPNLKDELFKDLSFSEIFSIIKDVVKSLNGFIAVLAKKIKFEKISFTLPINSSNPLKTQKVYGSTTNAFYLLSTQLQSKFFISYENPVFVADFENLLKDKEYFYIKITARTGFLIAVAIYLFKQYVYYKKTYLTQTDKDSQNLKGMVN